MEDFVHSINPIINLFGWALRFLGLIVFGLGAGWLTLDTLGKKDAAWQLKAVVVVGLMGFAGAMLRFSNAGAIAGFVLGSGVALLLWGRGMSSGTGGGASKK
jgi:hypothetical protein